MGKPQLTRSDGSIYLIRYDSYNCRLFLFFSLKSKNKRVEYFELRNEKAEYYIKNISHTYKKPFVPNKYVSSWAQFSILAKSQEHRSQVINRLKAKNIPSMIYYKTSLHLQSVYKSLGYKVADFPVSEDTSSRIFSIPMHPYLEDYQQDSH